MPFNYTKRKDGRLMKRISVNGRIKTIYSNNVNDLEKKYIELKYMKNIGNIVDDKNMSVCEWSDRWLKLYKSDKEKATIKMYSDAIRLYIKPNIGNYKLKTLKQSDILDMLNILDRKGITRKRDVALLTIKQILNKAVENDYIIKNVSSGIKIKRHKSEEKEPLTSDCISEIKKLSKTNSNAFMLLFMIYTGVRREEVVPLQYKDINFEEKYIKINKAVYFEKNQPTLKTTKNSEQRQIPIFNILFDTLKTMFDTHKKSDYIFTNRLGSMMSETSIKIKLNNVLNLLNKDLTEERKIKFTLHQLRHTYVCILHKAGVDIKQAQIWTGHKDVRVLLNIYTHLDSQDNQKSIDKVNQFLS